MAPLSWVFELKDQMSGPAKQIVINLNAVVQATDKVKASSKEAGHSIRDMAIGTGIEHMAEKVFELGKTFVEAVLEQHAYAEKTKIAFEVLTGSVSEANETFEEAQRVAMALARPAEEVGAAYKSLMLAGEKAENLETVTKAAADLASLGTGSLQSWAQVFADIRSGGDIAGRSLKQFKGVIDFDWLAKKMGTTVSGLSDVYKASSPQKRIQSLLDAIAQKEGGVLQTVSQKLANTFSGTVFSIKERLMDLFEFDSTDSPLLQFLHGVRDALEPNGPLVKKIREGAGAFLEGLGIFNGGPGGGGMSEFLKQLKSGDILGANFKKTMREVGEDVRVVAQAVGQVAEGIVSVSKALTHLHRGYESMAASGTVKEATAEQAAGAMPFLSMSPSERYGGVAKAALHGLFGESDVEKGMTVIPSKVPHFASGGRVTSPTLALIGEGGEPETVIPDSKLGNMGARITLHNEQHFHIHGVEENTVRQLAGDLHAMGLGDFQGALDTLAQLAGAI